MKRRFETAITLSALAFMLGGCELGAEAELEPMTFDEFVDNHISVSEVEGHEILTFDYDEPLDSWQDVDRLYEAYWISQTDGEVSANVLLDTLPNGVGLVWDSNTRQNLIYCVSDKFGGRKADVVKAMDRATRSWEKYAGLNFIHASGQDSTCSLTNPNVVFSVYPVTGQRYIARAFFPKHAQDRIKRNVLINDSAFATVFPLEGVLRHELGHTLGLRHETIQPRAASKYGGQCLENDLYLRITAGFDEKSVMVTPACVGGQRMIDINPDIELSARDKAGIRVLYP